MSTGIIQDATIFVKVTTKTLEVYFKSTYKKSKGVLILGFGAMVSSGEGRQGNEKISIIWLDVGYL